MRGLYRGKWNSEGGKRMDAKRWRQEDKRILYFDRRNAKFAEIVVPAFFDPEIFQLVLD